MNSSQELHGSSQPAGDSLSEVTLADGGPSVMLFCCQILSTQPACDSLLEVTQADGGWSAILTACFALPIVLRQRLSMTLHRENARVCLRRFGG